jgi:Tfp pilus assembly protein PilF
MKRTAAVIIFAAMMMPVASSAHYEGDLLPDSVAVMEYQMVISMAPKDMVTRNKLGMVYLRQNKLDKARKEFLGILKADPQNFDALDSLGLVSDREAKFKDSVDWYGKALKVRLDAGVKLRLDAATAKLKAGK